MKHCKSLLLFVSLLALAGSAFASTTVCDFESQIGTTLTPDGYCNITWSLDRGWVSYVAGPTPYDAHSPVRAAYTYGSAFTGENRFSFSTPQTFQGAWFAGYSSATLYFHLYDSSNNLLWTSASLTPSATTTWLSSGYSGLVSTVGVYSANQGYFVMDDVTYGGAATPEPGTLGLLATGAFGALGAIRRRFAK